MLDASTAKLDAELNLSIARVDIIRRWYVLQKAAGIHITIKTKPWQQQVTFRQTRQIILTSASVTVQMPIAEKTITFNILSFCYRPGHPGLGRRELLSYRRPGVHR